MNRHPYHHGDVAGTFGPHEVPASKGALVWVLVFGAMYVYLYQRTYYPGS